MVQSSLELLVMFYRTNLIYRKKGIRQGVYRKFGCKRYELFKPCLAFSKKTYLIFI